MKNGLLNPQQVPHDERVSGLTSTLLRTVFLAVLLGLFGHYPAEAARFFGDVEIDSLPYPASPRRAHGYSMHRLRITNHAPDKEQFIRLVIPDQTYGSGSIDIIRRIERSVRVAPSSSVMIDIPQPPLTCYGNNRYGIYINNRDAGDLDMTGSVKEFDANSINHVLNVLLSTRVNNFRLDKQLGTLPVVSSWKGPSHGGGTGKPYELIRSDIPTHNWSANWLAYSHFDGIVITRAEWEAVAPEIRDALESYANTGGSLSILGYNAGQVDFGLEVQSLKAGAAHHAGFGVIHTFPEHDLEKTPLPQDSLNHLFNSWDHSRKPWLDPYQRARANTAFPVVDKLGVPVRRLFLLILVFALLIGPINLILLSKKKRRIWLLWTIPAISLLTCLLIFFYSLFAEGLTATARTRVITWLDQTRQRAATVGLQAFYSPLTPGDGLHYSLDTEVSPQVGGYSHRGGIARTLTVGGDQHLKTGWITSRIPSHFVLRKSQPRKERLEISRDGDRITVLNGLGADIKNLWVRGEGKAVYKVDALKAGARVTMKPEIQPKWHPAGLRSIYRKNRWEDQFAKLMRKPTTHLAPQQFLAELKTSPFIEPGLASARTRPDTSLVLGQFTFRENRP